MRNGHGSFKQATQPASAIKSQSPIALLDCRLQSFVPRMCRKSFSFMRNGTRTRSYRSPIEGLPVTGFWIGRLAGPRRVVSSSRRMRAC